MNMNKRYIWKGLVGHWVVSDLPWPELGGGKPHGPLQRFDSWEEAFDFAFAAASAPLVEEY